MIVVDSSALIAILFEEPEKQAFQNIIAGGFRCVISAVNAHETATVLRLKRGQSPGPRMNDPDLVRFGRAIVTTRRTRIAVCEKSRRTDREPQRDASASRNRAPSRPGRPSRPTIPGPYCAYAHPGEPDDQW